MIDEQILNDLPVLNDFQVDVLDEVLYGNHRVIMLPGSRYGGKTFIEILAQMMHGMKYERPRLLLGGPAYDDIRANTTEAIEYWSDALDLRLNWPKGATEFTVGDQTWEVRGLLHEQGARRVKGRGYKGAVIDELSEIHAANWHMVFTSVRGAGVKIIASWNPKGPRHFSEIMAKNPEPFNGVVVHSTMTDNKHADPDSVAAFQNRDAFPDFQYQRLVMGLPAAPEGQVYPHYYTTDKSYVPGQPCVVGVDYGESSVTSAHYAQRLPNNRWAIIKEYYYEAKPPLPKRDNNEHAREIIKAAPGGISVAYVDPSSKDLKEALRKHGVRVENGYNREEGYDITNGMLQRGEVVINEDMCPALVTTLQDLVYNKIMEKPDPNCIDHATDDMRYLCCGVSELRKSTFKGGD